MISPKFFLAFALALPAAVSHAAATEHHADAANAAAANASLVASLAEPSIPVISVTPSGERAQPVSAGIAESLPETPAVAVAPLRFNAAGEEQAARASRKPSRVSVTSVALPDEPGMLSLVEASPIGGVARRMQAQRFNTDDGVSANDFAICYRLNSRSSLQVIPGDPAPVKIPVSSFANNAGVTVGMVVRLSR